MGGKEQKCPIYISRIIPGGYADRCVCVCVCKRERESGVRKISLTNYLSLGNSLIQAWRSAKGGPASVCEWSGKE